MQWKLLAVIAICALISSFAGAACLSLIPQSVLRPFVFVMLIVIAIYTLVKKNFGQVHTEQKITTKMLILAGIGSLAIGFYDGIFGRVLVVSLFSSLSVFYKLISCMLQLCQKLVIL